MFEPRFSKRAKAFYSHPNHHLVEGNVLQSTWQLAINTVAICAGNVSTSNPKMKLMFPSTEDMPASAMRPILAGRAGPNFIFPQYHLTMARRWSPSVAQGRWEPVFPQFSNIFGYLRDFQDPVFQWFPMFFPCFPWKPKAPENLVDSMRDSRPMGWWALNRAWETGRLTVPGMWFSAEGSWQNMWWVGEEWSNFNEFS